MNRIIKHISMVLLSLIFFSCSKNEPIAKDINDIQTEVLQSPSIGVETFTAQDLSSESIDGLRATLESKGYSLPSLLLDREKLSDNQIKAHWGLIGNGYKISRDITNYLSEEEESSFNGDAIYISKQAGKPFVKMYCSFSGSELDKRFVWFAIDGKLRTSWNQQFLDFTTEAAPNQKVQGILAGDKISGLHIPIMTELAPYKSLNKDETFKFSPRGLLLSFCFINRLEEDITIKELVFDKNSSLFFEGSFETITKDKVSNGKEEGVKLAFKGVANDVAHTFPVYNGNTAGYQLAQETGVITSEMKNRLPLFNVWGYPREDNPIKLVVRYTKRNDSKVLRQIFRLNSESSFQDGYAYRMVIEIKPLPDIEPFPIDIIAEASDSDSNSDAYKNGVANTMLASFARAVLSNEDAVDLPGSSAYGRTFVASDYSNIGYLMKNEIGRFKVEKKNFIHPHSRLSYETVDNKRVPMSPWSLILPIASFDDKGHFSSSLLDGSPVSAPTTIEAVQTAISGEVWGNSPPYRIYRGEAPNKVEVWDIPYEREWIVDRGVSFIQRVPDPSHPSTSITYAIRAIGKPWQSAWEYRWVGSATTNDLRLIISAVALKRDLTIDETTKEELFQKIRHKDFFTRGYEQRRVIPYCGYKETKDGSIIRNQGTPYYMHDWDYNKNQYLVFPSNPTQQIRVEDLEKGSIKYKYSPVIGFEGGGA